MCSPRSEASLSEKIIVLFANVHKIGMKREINFLFPTHGIGTTSRHPIETGTCNIITISYVQNPTQPLHNCIYILLITTYIQKH